MLKKITLTLAAIGIAGAAQAQSVDFFLTYHVERFASSSLSIEDCASTAEAAARGAGYSVDTKAYPGQLVTVSGGAQNVGTFVVQCIAVDDKTVSVVQGIDYSQTVGPLGAFADGLFQAVKGAAKP